MSIQTSNNDKSNKKLTYNFYTVPLHSSDSILKNITNSTENNNGFIKVTNYPYNGKAAHITHDIFGASTSFTVTEMRIYKGIYNSADLQLVIETFSDKNEITYVCIPLKGENAGPMNDLDVMIQSMCLNKVEVCPQKLNLNKLISPQKSIDYIIKGDNSRIFNTTSGGNTPKKVCIVIFNGGIPISKTTVKVATSTGQSKVGTIPINTEGTGTSGGGSGSGYKYITKDNITSASNLSDSNIYIDCMGDDKDGVTEVLGGTYKLNEKDIKTIFVCFFIGLISVLIFYIADTLTVEKSVTTFDGIFKFLNKIYDETNIDYKLPVVNINVMLFLIIFIFMTCISLYMGSFLAKKGRVQLLISALYFTMFLFLLVYVKFLKSVANPP